MANKGIRQYKGSSSGVSDPGSTERRGRKNSDLSGEKYDTCIFSDGEERQLMSKAVISRNSEFDESLSDAGETGGEYIDNRTVVINNPVVHTDNDSSRNRVDATMVTENPLAGEKQIRKRLLGNFIVVSGREKGRVIKIEEGIHVVGRSRECDVTLLDIQVSRAHIEVTADYNGVRLEDLESGNGTFVNGEQVQQVNLVHGDEITVGDHVLRFEEEGPVASALPALVKNRGSPLGAVMPPVNQDSPSLSSVDVVRRARQRRAQDGGGRKKLFLLFGGLLIVGAFAGMAVALRIDNEPPEPPGPSPEQVAQRHFNEGMSEFRNKNYDEALAAFEKALEKWPEHREADRYVRASRNEIQARSAYDLGNFHLEQNNFSAARESFSKIREDSDFYELARAGINRSRDEEVREILIEADALFEDDELEEAADAYRRALEVAPDSEIAKRGLDRVRQQEEENKKLSLREQQRRKRAAAQRRRQRQQQARAQVNRALAVGENFFNRGEFQNAINAFQALAEQGGAASTQAQRKASAARAFRPLYESGKSSFDNRSYDTALRDLTEAERHASVVSNNGRMHRDVRRRLADIYAMQARLDLNQKRYQSAYKNSSQAIKQSPQHEQAKAVMRDLNGIAEELYLEGYTNRNLNPDRARQLFRQVMGMSSPNSEPHQRSRQRLAEMNN